MNDHSYLEVISLVERLHRHFLEVVTTWSASMRMRSNHVWTEHVVSVCRQGSAEINNKSA